MPGHCQCRWSKVLNQSGIGGFGITLSASGHHFDGRLSVGMGRFFMEEAQVLDIARDGILTMILIAAPVMLAGLVVGLVISLFQTLTQIQEMTLVFVPKIIIVFVAVLILLPFMIRQITELMTRLMDIAISLP